MENKPSNTINLKSDIEVKITLHPMPKKVDGRYPLLINGQPQISLTFSKMGRTLLRNAPWHAVISGKDDFPITPNIWLDEEDLEVLEDRGWAYMRSLGMFPTALV